MNPDGPLPRVGSRGTLPPVNADRSPECLEQLRAGGLLLIVDSASEPPEAVLA